MKPFSSSANDGVADILSKVCLPVDTHQLNPLMDRIGNARIVLLGEASHGTHEFYTWRAQITRRLIEEKGFHFIGVEGDWPDCYRINRYVKGYQGEYPSALEVVHSFNRWPTWMWANWEVVSLIEWLQGWNEQKPANQRVGFYGLDVYSLWESLEAMMEYLQQEDSEAAVATQQAIRCFEPYRKDDGQSYAWATSPVVPGPCEKDVINLLKRISQRMPQYDADREAVLSTEQNAHIAVNAEEYYRAMIRFGSDSWNIRDRHMTDTITRLLDFHGQNAKAIIWEHNTHIGDAHATDMKDEGMVNVGQLVRERYGKQEVVAVGFGSYQGEVIAGNQWGAPMAVMRVPEARKDSWEAMLHAIDGADKLLICKDVAQDPAFRKYFDHRAIGVVYHPDRERYGNYVPSVIPQRYDAFIFINETAALHPLHITPDRNKMPEAYPWRL